MLYIRDDELPSYIEIMLSHYKDPYSSISIMECHRGSGGVGIGRRAPAPTSLLFLARLTGILQQVTSVMGF